MMYKVFKLIFLFNVWFVSNIHADIIKYPNYSITHYPASAHGGVRATWGINQDKDGKLIFINTYGILSYDGSIWRSLKLEGNQIPRAIQTDENKNILIGYNEQFGMLSFDNKGQTKFKSLATLKLSPYATPREIIQIPDTKDYFIRTPNGIYIYNNKNVSLLKTPKEFRFGVSHKVNNEIYVYVIVVKIKKQLI